VKFLKKLIGLAVCYNTCKLSENWPESKNKEAMKSCMEILKNLNLETWPYQNFEKNVKIVRKILKLVTKILFNLSDHLGFRISCTVLL
jgi:hypothetical protein